MRISLLIGSLLGLAGATATVALAAGGLPNIGAATTKAQPVYRGYYDKHIDTYVITDVSDKAQADAMHINYSAELKTVKGIPDQYFVKGRAASGQLAVFGSEPGKPDYNPLWEEIWVIWKPGVTPVLLGRDDQINALAKAGKLTKTDAHVVLNAPILEVGKGK